jgi:hypothetical protein
VAAGNGKGDYRSAERIYIERISISAIDIGCMAQAIPRIIGDETGYLIYG